MKKYPLRSALAPWLTAMLLTGLLAACGGGREPVLGSEGVAVLALAPTVTAVTPLANAVNVPLNTQVLSVAFSQTMNPATLNAASVTLACPLATPITGSVNYLPASNTATLTMGRRPVGRRPAVSIEATDTQIPTSWARQHDAASVAISGP